MYDWPYCYVPSCLIFVNGSFGVGGNHLLVYLDDWAQFRSLAPVKWKAIKAQKVGSRQREGLGN